MLELDLQAVLKTVCPQVVMGVAPSGTKTPYITWQHIGGDPLIFLDNSQADKRNALIQINAYHSTGLAALQLLQVVQAALLASTAKFVARPLSEPIAAPDDADAVQGFLQTVSITGAR